MSQRSIYLISIKIANLLYNSQIETLKAKGRFQKFFKNDLLPTIIDIWKWDTLLRNVTLCKKIQLEAIDFLYLKFYNTWLWKSQRHENEIDYFKTSCRQLKTMQTHLFLLFNTVIFEKYECRKPIINVLFFIVFNVR